jgi:hypothetical protein
MKTEHVQTQIFSQILDSMLTARHSIVHLRDQFICIGDAADEDGSADPWHSISHRYRTPLKKCRIVSRWTTRKISRHRGMASAQAVRGSSVIAKQILWQNGNPPGATAFHATPPVRARECGPLSVPHNRAAGNSWLNVAGISGSD